MDKQTENRVQDLIRTLVSSSKNKEIDFVSSRYTYEQVYNMASHIMEFLSQTSKRSDMTCLCTDDRGITAAALIATLAYGCRLIVPYSCSGKVLHEIRKDIHYKTIISDKAVDAPPGIRMINPSPQNRRDIKHMTHPVLPDDNWLVLFTGGSTGRPRTWSKTPRNMLCEAIYFRDRFRINRKDIFIATVPPYHIYGLLHSVLIPFISLAQVYPHTPMFPNEILGAIRGTGHGILVSIPVHYRTLTKLSLHRLPLRLAISSGAVLDRETATRFCEQTGVKLIEIYGSTETGGIATRSPVKGEEAFVPLECVDWEIDGEILSIDSPFVSKEMKKNAHGLFVTGDRAMCNGKGFVLLGRKDGIVKVGGKRVDTEEIREALLSISSVRNAVILPMPYNKMGRGSQLAALVESDTDAKTIRQILSKKLPPYSIPRKIKVVTQIPLTVVGKNNQEEIRRLIGENDTSG